MTRTPGPWVANDQHQGVGWRVESDADGYPNDGWVIASDMLGPDAADNARLIAAAPDLLEALEAIMGERWSPAGRSEQVSDLARTAISRAKGSAS